MIIRPILPACVASDLKLVITAVHDCGEGLEIAHGVHGVDVLVWDAPADDVRLARDDSENGGEFGFGPGEIGCEGGGAGGDLEFVDAREGFEWEFEGLGADVMVGQMGEAGIEEWGEDL